MKAFSPLIAISALCLSGLITTSPASAFPSETVSFARTATPAQGRFSGRIAIRGGRKIYLECRGSGNPLVMLEAGTGDMALTWTKPPLGPGPAVLPAVSRFTRVCAYDRPGTYSIPGKRSRSDPVAMPRTARDIVRDLHALLRATRIPGPYVLAGHSFGGMVARLFATSYPGAMAGLVSVDAQNEDFTAAYKEFFPPEVYIAAVLDPQPPRGLKNYAAVELLNLAPSAAQMHQAQTDTPLRKMPLVVLSHSRTDPNPFHFPPSFPIKGLNRAFQASQNMLARLVPGARHVIAKKSGHYIQDDQPNLVTREIRGVIDEVRRQRGR
ncbi:MAG: alpha/beta fold hydrolase [Solirubrobacterales bacterium]